MRLGEGTGLSGRGERPVSSPSPAWTPRRRLAPKRRSSLSRFGCRGVGCLWGRPHPTTLLVLEYLEKSKAVT